MLTRYTNIISITIPLSQREIFWKVGQEIGGGALVITKIIYDESWAFEHDIHRVQVFAKRKDGIEREWQSYPLSHVHITQNIDDHTFTEGD